jgi:hypothetical protein
MIPRPAWWPTVVAGLLLASGGGWLFRALPSPPASSIRLGGGAALRSAAVAAGLAALQPEPEMPADTAMRFTAYDLLAGDTLAQPLTAHRYMGAFGGRAIVVQLLAGANWAEGSWYYRTGRPTHERRLVFRERRGSQLVLGEDIVTPTDADTSATEWRLSWPLGRVLSGQRRALHGPGRQAVRLHTGYAQAVPYQVLTLTAHGIHCDAVSGHPQSYYLANFVRLLGADSLRLSLWQAPLPAARHDSLRHWLNSESCQQTSKRLDVMLNDYGLWSYNVWTDAYYYGTHHEHEQEGFIVDQRTGDEWLVEELLRPSTEPALLKLLARHLRHDYPEVSQEDGWDWKTVPPLPDSFALTPTGLYAGYDDYALTGSPTPYVNNTTIPYAELRPLVRPGTPLARMLRARGLW